MKEKKHLDNKDIAVLEMLDDPIWFGEFIRSAAEEEGFEGRDWSFDNYQKRMLLDESHYITACTGRATGKTICLETKIIHKVVTNVYKKASENEVLFVVQNKAQLEPVFLRLTKFFRRHDLLRFFIDKNSVNLSQHEIKLLNGSLVRCRIIGATADSNIIGMHVPCIFVDEAQVFSYTAWNSLQQALNTWDDGYQMWVSGVPNGLREKNVLYECDQLNDKFSKHNVSRLESPRYTEDRYADDLKQYGGVEGDDFIHLVKGEHGSPAFSVFDRKMMKIERYPVALSMMNNLALEQIGGNFTQLLDVNISVPINDLIVCAVDTGFSTDPTIITILYSYNNKWRELARYELRRIKYPVQARILDWLDGIFRFNMITIDAGSSGLALGQILQENEKIFKRVVLVDFQGGVVTDYDEEGKEIKSRIKPFTIQLLQRWAQNDQMIIFSEQDDALISELERVGFTRDMLGQPKYFVYSPQGGQRGDDHILASLLTWVYGLYYNYYSPKPNRGGKFSDLAKGGWLVGGKLRGGVK